MILSKKTKIILITSAVAILLIAIVTCVLVLILRGDGQGCEIFSFELDAHPLIVLSGTSSFLYPARNKKVIKFPPNQQVDFICPGRNLWLGLTETNSSLVSGTCASGTIFQIGDRRVNWTEMSCDGYPWRNTQKLMKGCQLKSNRDNAPLVLRLDKYEFIYPQVGQTELKFTSGEQLQLVCPGNTIKAGQLTYANITTAKCISNDNLNVNGTKNIRWNNITCTATVRRTAKLSGKKCENNGSEVEIGFAVNDDIFLKVISICFDETTQQALYAQATITASINQRTKSVPRPSWLQTVDIYNIKSPNTYYGRDSQRKTLNSLLGLPENSDKYIQNATTYYLSRGHLSARSDNFYPAQQNVSFFLLNVAPQWQTCNAGNWEAVETYIRNYAEERNVDLIAWTGVYGVTRLPHAETGELEELYLYYDGNRTALPVPEFFWKVAYEPISQKGVVFIVINNPYVETFKPICQGISDKIDWIKWKRDDQKKGFGYACAVDRNFRKVVNFLPQFTVKGILT